MASGATVVGLEKVVLGLRNLAKRHKPMTEAVVKYGGPGVEYAVIVHEDMQAHHPNGGQAKYLEQAIRTTSSQVAAEVRKRIGAGETMTAALKAGAEIVLAESQKLVPVSTGALKGSGRVEVR